MQGQLMQATPQHGLLTRLLDYVVEQGKEIDPRAYVLTGASDFRRFPKDLAGLPGVELDRKVEGDHIWLQVARLESTSPPAPDDQSRPYITFSDDPSGLPPALNDTALKHRLVTDRRSMSEEAAATGDLRRRERIAHALAHYTPLWQAWAEGEKPRRRTISLYGDLFMLKGRLEAEESSTPSELVWGMGVSAWRFSGTLTDNGNGKPVSIDYQYPLLTQVVEIDLDAQTHTISV
ncbi:MAG: very short patch repair endonuclease, partial [Pseudomonadota bacterium]